MENGQGSADCIYYNNLIRMSCIKIMQNGGSFKSLQKIFCLLLFFPIITLVSFPSFKDLLGIERQTAINLV